MRAAALVFNPRSGAHGAEALVPRVRQALERGGFTVELCPTRGPGHAAEICAGLGEGAAPSLACVLGGDGTLNEAVTGAFRAGLLGGSSGSGGGRLQFAVLPAGTTNVVARDLGMPRDPVEGAALLARGAVRRLDLGLLECGEVSRPFVLAAGVGFDAEVVRLVPSWLKRVLGAHAYSLAAALHAGPDQRGLSVTWAGADGRTGSARPASLLVANTPHYGAGVLVSSSSRPDDGVLELVLLPSTGLVPLLRMGIRGLRDELRNVPGVQVVPVRQVAVDAPGPVPAHVDAEPFGQAPLRVRVLPGALPVLVAG